jgi:hypothetical protein
MRAAALALTGTALAVPASARAVPTDNACLVWGAKYTLVEQSKFALVFSKDNPHVNSAGPSYYACVFSREKSYVLPRQGEGSTLGGFQLAGRYVGYSTVFHDEAVADHSGAFVVFDAKDGKTKVNEPAWPDPVTEVSTDVVDLALTGSGAVAWVGERFASPAPPIFAVQWTAAGGKHEVDRGLAIDPHSLAIARDGKTVFWLDGGAARSAPLG